MKPENLEKTFCEVTIEPPQSPKCPNVKLNPFTLLTVSQANASVKPVSLSLPVVASTKYVATDQKPFLNYPPDQRLAGLP